MVKVLKKERNGTPGGLYAIFGSGFEYSRVSKPPTPVEKPLEASDFRKGERNPCEAALAIKTRRGENGIGIMDASDRSSPPRNSRLVKNDQSILGRSLDANPSYPLGFCPSINKKLSPYHHDSQNCIIRDVFFFEASHL